MKIEIKNFKKTFKNSFTKRHSRLIDPMREWLIGLSLAVILFIGGVSFTAYDFYSQLVSPPQAEVEVKPLEYRQSEVQFYADLYKEKEETFNALRSRPVTLIESSPQPEAGEDVVSSENEEDELDDEILAEEPVAE